MAFKTGDNVKVVNKVFRVCGCKGKVISIDGKLIAVELKRLHKKLDETPTVIYNYYPSDLRLVG